MISNRLKFFIKFFVFVLVGWLLCNFFPASLGIVDVQALSVPKITDGMNYQQSSINGNDDIKLRTHAFATTNSTVVYPYSSYNNPYFYFGYLGVQFVTASVGNTNAIGYTITSTYKILFDGINNNVGIADFAGYAKFQQGSVVSETSNIEVIGLTSGGATFKVTTTVQLSSSTSLSTILFDLHTVGTQPFATASGGTFTVQLTLLSLDVQYATSLDSAILSSLNQNQIQTNQKLDEVKEETKKATEEQKKTNSILTDDSIDDNININQDSITDESGIQDLLLMPLTLMNAVNTGFNSSCSSFTLGSLYGHDLSLKCFTISDVVGSDLAGIIDVIISGIFIYLFSKHLRKVFDRTTNLENEEGDVI